MNLFRKQTKAVLHFRLKANAKGVHSQVGKTGEEKTYNATLLTVSFKHGPSSVKLDQPSLTTIELLPAR